MLQRVYLPVVCLLLVAPGSHGQDEWQSEHFADHPLAGKIYNTATGTFVTPSALLSTLNQSRFILLGEKHDNPDHHRLRLSLLENLIRTDHMSLLSFEMMDNSQQAALAQLQDSRTLQDENQIRNALSWDDAWTWEFYQVPLMLALQSGIELRAGNIDRDQIRSIYTQTDTADQPLDAEQVAALTQEIDLSHCGMLPESQFPAMVRVQQARDRAMADSLLDAPQARAAVLMAGNFHIRHDLGVSNYLSAGNEKPVNVAFLEVSPGRELAGDYVPTVAGITAYDFIWFTPVVQIEDYCAQMQVSAGN